MTSAPRKKPLSAKQLAALAKGSEVARSRPRTAKQLAAAAKGLEVARSRPRTAKQLAALAKARDVGRSRPRTAKQLAVLAAMRANGLTDEQRQRSRAALIALNKLPRSAKQILASKKNIQIAFKKAQAIEPSGNLRAQRLKNLRRGTMLRRARGMNRFIVKIHLQAAAARDVVAQLPQPSLKSHGG